MRTRFGYIFGGFTILLAFAVAGLALASATSTMNGMHRVAMPGATEIVLPFGPSSLYAESDRDFPVDCTLTGLELRPPPQPVSYSLAGFRGRKLYDVDVANGGSYQLACKGEAPFTIAIGAGVGAFVTIEWLAIVPLVIGIAIVVTTYVRRRRATKRAAPSS